MPIPSPNDSNPAVDETNHFTDLNTIYNYPLPEPEKRGLNFFLLIIKKEEFQKNLLI